MFSTRRSRSGLPCGKMPRCETFAETNSIADAFLHAATHAPQPMHAAASMASSASLRNRKRVRVRRAAGVHRNKAARLDDAVERAAIHHQILDDRKRLRAPRLDRDRLAVLEVAHVKLAGGRAAHARHAQCR